MVFPFPDEHLQVVVTALLQFLRTGCEDPLQAVLRRSGIGQIESRIVFEVGFRDADFHPVAGVDRQRQEHQPSGIERRKACRGVGVLERIEELTFEIPLIASRHIRNRGLEIGGETVFRLFAHDVERLFRAAHEAVGDAVVVGTELHRPVVLHAQRQGVVTLAERIGAVERRRDHSVDARARDARHARVNAPRRAVVERQRERRGVQHRAAVERDGVGQRVVCGDGRLKASLRRGERVGFPGLRGECARDGGCKQQERFSHHFFSFSELHIFSLIFRIRPSSTFTALRS